MLLNKKSIYIGNGFKSAQLQYLIPIVISYAKSKKIKNILLDFKYKSFVSFYNKSNLVKFIFLKNNYTMYFFKGLYFIYNFLKFRKFYYIFISPRKFLLQYDNWYNYQIKHSIWDTSVLYTKDNDLNPSFFQKVRAFKEIISALYKGKELINNYYLDSAFMSHSVYNDRALIALFRMYKVNIFTHSNYSLAKNKSSKDFSINVIHNYLLKKFIKIINQYKCDRYWLYVQKGFSLNTDTKIAFNIKKKLRTVNDCKNIIFLHVFKDSPFNILDKKRIFCDYVEWVEQTLKILKFSKEKWILRIHPVAKYWGEDSYIKVNIILKKVFGENIPKNIIVEVNSINNLDQLKSLNRVVTYTGSSHLEAVCSGIKPIVISETTLSSYNKDFVLKPINLNQYKKFLLIDSHSRIFKATNEQVKIAKKIIYIKDNVISFKNIFDGAQYIYRNSSKKSLLRYSKAISKGILYQQNYLQDLGKHMAKGLQQSISKKFIKLLN